MAGILWVLTSAVLLGQSTIQFTDGRVTADETVRQVVLPVERSNDLETEVAVEFFTVEDTATAGQDFTTVSGILSFGAGVTQQTITVPILNDALIEPTERFVVMLTNATEGAVLGARKLLGISIQDNDLGVRFATGYTQMVEDIGVLRLVVYRGNDGDQPVTVDYATMDGTALADTDYEAASGTLTFEADDTFQEIAVVVLNDGVNDPQRSFQVQLSHATGGGLGTPSVATVLIIDNDPGLHFASGSYRTVEDSGEIRLVVYRGNDGDQTVTVDYATIDGTALGGTDYEAASGTLTFEADDSFKEITVLVLNDGVTDPDKSFQVQLSNATNGGLGTRSVATVTIQDPTPVIFTQPTPVGQSVSLGAAVKLQASAKGAVMRWQRRTGESEFTDVAGATGQVLEFRSATLDMSGEYKFVVSSTTGESVTSQIARVTVDPTFIQITGQPIADDRESSNHSVWFDYDEDGWIDLLVPNLLEYATEPRPRSSLYRNQGDGTFARVTHPLVEDLGGVFPVVCADFDNDGHTDVFVAESSHHGGYRGRIFLNHGSGLFQSLSHNLGAAFSAAARDIDGDGWVDLVLSNGSCLVYRNVGGGQFESRHPKDLGVLVNVGSVSSSFVDFDHDGRLDLYLATESDPGRLLRNVGGFAFQQIQAGSLPGTVNTLSSAWADYDNNGFFDLLTVSSAWGGGHAPRLHRNVPHPDQPSQRVFEDVSAPSGLLQLAGSTFGPAWGDFNNDGYLDLFLARSGHLGSASTNTLMINQGDGTFLSVNVGSPLAHSISFSAHWGDYDNDGFLDLFIPCGWSLESPNLLFRNNLPNLGNQNRWLKVQLDGRASNRSGIGAVLRLRATLGGREMWQTRQIASNGNTWGQGPELVAHFGLGDAEKVDVLHIEWPSGIVQELTHLAVNQQLQIVETQGLTLPEPLSVQTSALDAEGVFHATVNCPVEGAVCVLESSADLERWTKVKVGTVSGGTVELTDARATQSPTRFYRVSVP